MPGLHSNQPAATAAARLDYHLGCFVVWRFRCGCLQIWLLEELGPVAPFVSRSSRPGTRALSRGQTGLEIFSIVLSIGDDTHPCYLDSKAR
jgi:hypothetical protein